MSHSGASVWTKWSKCVNYESWVWEIRVIVEQVWERSRVSVWKKRKGSVCCVNRNNVKQSVRRHQFPMTLAYAFMDYRSQGQTILFIMVDIATPPTGGLSLFNLYVALSRSSSRSTIRLLWDFNNTTFIQSHSASLLQEDDRLDKLDALTKSWWHKMGRDVRENHVQATWVVTFLEISVNYNELQKLLASTKHHSDVSFAC